MDVSNELPPDQSTTQTLMKSCQNSFIQGRYGESLLNMCRLFTYSSSIKEELRPHFVIALGKYTKYLENTGSWEELFSCFEKALNVFPECEEVHHTLGAVLFRLGFVDKAACYFRQAILLNPDFEAARESLESVKNALLERWHFSMINDQHRNKAFYEAIKKAVEQGHTSVLDIGTGTGILSMFASQCGAQKVYACEVSEVLCEVAKDVLQANGFALQVHLINKMSTEMSVPTDLPERVSMVVTETFDAGLFGEHVLSTLIHAIKELMLPLPSLVEKNTADAGQVGCSIGKDANNSPRRSFLKMQGESSTYEKAKSEGFEQLYGKVIPHSAVVWASLVECKSIRNKTRSQDGTLKDIRVCFVREQEEGEPYTTERLSCVKGGFNYLCKPWKLMAVNFNNLKELEKLQDGISRKFSVKCSKMGYLDAVVLWFDLYLDKNIILSTNPSSNLCWEQAVFPVLPTHVGGRTVCVSPESTVALKMTCKGHLSLQCLNVRNVLNFDNCNHELEAISLKPQIIHELNDRVASSSFHYALSKVFNKFHRPCVIDLNDFPWFGIQALKMGAKTCAVRCSTEKHKLLMLTEKYGIPSENLTFTTVEDLCDSDNSAWDALIFNPVEESGILKRQIIEDVALIRASVLKSQGLVIPSKLSLYCQLIDSIQLAEQARAVGDDRTLNLKVAQFVNVFQSRTHEDVILCNLVHNKLSDKIHLVDIDFQSDAPSNLVDISNVVNVKTTSLGQVTAAAYWFTMQFCSDATLDTSDPETHWNQAAVVTFAPLHVEADQELELTCSCRKSVVDISIIKK